MLLNHLTNDTLCRSFYLLLNAFVSILFWCLVLLLHCFLSLLWWILMDYINSLMTNAECLWWLEIDLHNETEHATTKSNMIFVFEFVLVLVYFLLQWLKRNVSCVTKGVCKWACYCLYWYLFLYFVLFYIFNHSFKTLVISFGTFFIKSFFMQTFR